MNPSKVFVNACCGPPVAGIAMDGETIVLSRVIPIVTTIE